VLQQEKDIGDITRVSRLLDHPLYLAGDRVRNNAGSNDPNLLHQLSVARLLWLFG